MAKHNKPKSDGGPTRKPHQKGVNRIAANLSPEERRALRIGKQMRTTLWPDGHKTTRPDPHVFLSRGLRDGDQSANKTKVRFE